MIDKNYSVKKLGPCFELLISNSNSTLKTLWNYYQECDFIYETHLLEGSSCDLSKTVFITRTTINEKLFSLDFSKLE